MHKKNKVLIAGMLCKFINFSQIKTIYVPICLQKKEHLHQKRTDDEYENFPYFSTPGISPCMYHSTMLSSPSWPQGTVPVLWADDTPLSDSQCFTPELNPRVFTVFITSSQNSVSFMFGCEALRWVSITLLSLEIVEELIVLSSNSLESLSKS